MVEHPVFNYVENICVVYFTLEYLLRFWVAPRKLSFVKDLLNIIDLLAIAPFIFEIVLILVGLSGEKVRKVRKCCFYCSKLFLLYESKAQSFYQPRMDWVW